MSQTNSFTRPQAFAALREIVRSLSSAWDLDTTLNLIARKTTEVMQVDSCTIYLLDPEGQWIEFPIPGTGQDALPNGDDSGLEEIPLPPEPPTIPVGWFELAESLPDGQDAPAPVGGDSPPVARSRSGNTSGSVETGPVESVR